VRHPNVCEVDGLGVAPDGSVFLVLQLLEGEDLRGCLRREIRLPAEGLLVLCEHVCAGLAAVRDAGAVHRDLKPENIYFHLPTRTYKLLDFGIAKVFGGIAMTARGQILGTAEYMSPEQARGGDVDIRSDIYSLGCVLWEAAGGRPPFVGKNFIEVLTQHRDKRPEPLADHGASVSPSIERVILRSLEKNPDARFQTPEAMAEAMRAAHDLGKSPSLSPDSAGAPSWTERLMARLRGGKS
jgi:serine/threonine-protein kinase